MPTSKRARGGKRPDSTSRRRFRAGSLHSSPSDWLLLASGRIGTPLVPLTRGQQSTLFALRSAVPRLRIPADLSSGRPASHRPTAAISSSRVDASRSMRIEDVDGRSRLAAATSLLTSRSLPAFRPHVGRPELFKVADGLAEASVENLSADGATDLVGAVNARVNDSAADGWPGTVVLSDGGDTGQHPIQGGDATGAPVSTIGVGTVEGVRPIARCCRLALATRSLDQALVDVHVTTPRAASARHRTPFAYPRTGSCLNRDRSRQALTVLPTIRRFR